MRLALFEPDIPGNAGSLIRLGACMGVGVDIIEPCGFLFTDKALKRAGMDYLDAAEVIRHASWAEFLAVQRARGGQDGGRLLVLTAKAALSYIEFEYAAGDTLLLGRESAGAPQEVHDAADARLRIPLKPGMRSLNVAQAGAMALGEALRQTRGFPV